MSEPNKDLLGAATRIYSGLLAGGFVVMTAKKKDPRHPERRAEWAIDAARYMEDRTRQQSATGGDEPPFPESLESAPADDS